MAATTTGVKLDSDTRARLKRLGEIKDRSPHWLMKQAILRYLEAEEEYERQRVEDAARYERYLATGEHITNEEMTGWFNDLARDAAEKGVVEE